LGGSVVDFENDKSCELG